MNVWIDITNSPHVVFFKPIIEDLKKRGYSVTVTAREFAQTIPMLEMHKMEYVLIGHHRGKNLFKKAVGLFSRVKDLINFARDKNFDLALSHGSNDLTVACWLLRVPSVVIHDYEHATLSYKVNARLAGKILIPEAIPKEAVAKHGAVLEKIEHFPGLKENVYLNNYPIDSCLNENLGIDNHKILVVLRPPATMAAYHRFENPLFKEVVLRLGSLPNTAVIVLPRTDTQAAELNGFLPDNFIIPETVIDGPSLLALADVVISAGGTMNREAAVLGTPVYTIFRGKMGAVDEYLISIGALHRIKRADEITVKKKTSSSPMIVENREIIIEKALSAAIKN